ncbi:MAG TPA: hypothetical protein PJ982_16830, partial [Lacipirellulaceae bacterium]|nr:hypothetical protein [Lacipirellulaceae bacterium]
LVRGAGPAPPLTAWHEPQLQVAADVIYAPQDDRLQLANVRVDGQTVSLTGGGSIDQLRTAALVRGDVVLNYDGAAVGQLLAAYLGPGVQVQGAKPLRVVATGRLSAAPDANRALSPAPPVHWSRQWLLTCETGLAGANMYGLPVGPLQVVANVHDGQMQFNPLDVAVGQGRLALQPRVTLDPPPQQLLLAGGPLASRVAVSPEVSEAMLKYAAPILASATRMSGTFSLFTEGVVVPLGNPRQMSTTGRLTMHDLAILPGPGLAEVVALIQRMEQLSRGRPEDLLGVIAPQPTGPVRGITMSERTVDIQVADGRVYHRNLEFLIDDVPVRSYGSVGFDQTIALVIHVPVQAKWGGRSPALQGLVGQTIEIPVSGTMTRWRVDQRAVGNFLAQAAQSAVGGALGDELNKALDGLFRRK